MEIKRGIPVSPGVVIGPAFVYDAEHYRIPDRFITPGSYPDEIARLRPAMDAAAAEAQAHEHTLTQQVGADIGAIFTAHAMMIADPSLRKELEALIRDRGYTAEYAVSAIMRKRARILESLDQQYHAARVVDLHDVEQRILKHLLGNRQEPLERLREPVVVLARDLTPSQTATLNRKFVLAFATELGGRTSHTAIMAGVLEIPAVVGVGRFLHEVSGGDQVIVDGTHGVLIINPSTDTLAHYEQARLNFQSFEKGLTELRDLPAVTKDGEKITLLGNIEFPDDADLCLARGGEGIGLYRTEFLYLNRSHGQDPSEEEHYAAYKKVVDKMGDLPVTIRTLDLGADKFSSVVDPKQEERNPFLGVRSVRICLQNLSLFKTQMRAILRSSAYGNVRIMFPMISTVRELRQCKHLLKDVMEDLEEEGIPFNRNLPIGTMIEVPSAAIMAEQLAREVDFFSIGTNDLIQYTLAADRTNGNVADLYDASDPAVLWLIERVVAAARKHKVDVNVCGEMSGAPMHALLLVGMGLRRLSATPHNIPEIKKLIRSITLEEAKKAAHAVRPMVNARNVANYLREQLRRVMPEMAD